MKKIILLAISVFLSIGAKAQFEQGTHFVNASLSGLDLSFSKSNRFNLGLKAKAGYYVADHVAIIGFFNYTHGRKSTTVVNNTYYDPNSENIVKTETYQQKKYFHDFQLGAGMRYNITQNGLYLGAGVAYDHYDKTHNDLLIPVEIGYTFYLNHYLTIEPSLNYNTSMFHFTDNSKVGFNIGMGYYF